MHALSAAGCRSFAAGIFVEHESFSAILVLLDNMKIQTHKWKQKVNFAKDKVRVCSDEVAFENAVKCRGRITAKISVCWMAKRSPQNARAKGTGL